MKIDNRHSLSLRVMFAAAALCLFRSPPVRSAESEIDFTRDIRPILSSTCFSCHGPDEHQREADLRLDVADGAFADRGGYAALVPGELEQSALWQRITSSDPDERMPPADFGTQLTDEQIGLLRRWIESGAAWAEHWAFVPPERPPVPAVSDAAWVRNPIDAFVLSRLEQEGLLPSPEADKVALLRRLTLDLVGLPPSISDVDAFVADDGDQAYRRQLQGLLNSPHYGERWARFWLDAARYADSDGFEKDKPREVWFYRDYVINALNRDLPYNQFVIEQIAGDLLPEATQDQVVATGFLRNSMVNEEGGVDPEQFRMEAMFDRMDAIGKSMLGLTIQCGQCHSHKYDPLTQQDYYRMFAFLNNCHEAQITVYTRDQQQQRRRVLQEIRAIEEQLQRSHGDWPQRMAAWEEQLRTAEQPAWVVARLEFDDKTIGGQKFLPQPDGSYLAQGYAPTKFRPRMMLTTDLEPIAAIRLELLTDPNLPHGGPGRSIWGTCALTEFEVDAAPASDPGQTTTVKIASATADIAQAEKPLDDAYHDKSQQQRVTGGVAFAIDGKRETAWGIDAGPGRRNEPRKAVFVFEQPIGFDDGTRLSFYLTQMHGGWNSDDNQTHNLGRFRISLTTSTDATADPLPATVRQILEIPRQQRTEQQARTVFSYWRTTVEEWAEANQRIERLWQQHPVGSSQLALSERDRQRPTHRLERGDFLKPQESVAAGVPEFLHALPEEDAPPRLRFARWLADRNSPTTARSIVNRVWQAYFGTGLVSTSEDLGSQSDAASHPRLLDWLAVEFMENGWSLKQLHSLIVSSSTYRQSSRVTPELYARDPYNRLLARGPRFRVEAEIVRDIALAASGLLNPDIGGPSVYPPAPEFLFVPPASYGPKTWKHDPGPNRYRRALYTFRFRSVPYPTLQAFDTPNGDFSCVRRARSNTPLQALATLNEPLFMECARALALRTLASGSSDDERLAHAFRRCLARRPATDESRVLLDLLHRQQERFAVDGQAARQLAGSDPGRPTELPADTTPEDLAAWTVVSRVLLNLDETITKE